MINIKLKPKNCENCVKQYITFVYVILTTINAVYQGLFTTFFQDIIVPLSAVDITVVKTPNIIAIIKLFISTL